MVTNDPHVFAEAQEGAGGAIEEKLYKLKLVDGKKAESGEIVIGYSAGIYKRILMRISNANLELQRL
jgi:hypothetical protein